MPTLLAFSLSPPCPTRKSPPHITCVSSDPENIAINRRNVCVGGGLYGATATFGNMAAAAAPVQPPDINDIKTCKTAVDDQLANPVMCCPPYGNPSEIIDFSVFPRLQTELRIRKPAHKLSIWEVDRFRTAVRTMKEFNSDHPWNWMQQAQIHCAFCNDGYKQVGYPDVPLQIHGSWLFLPWHRYYLYFWESILGKLIDDPTFAVPYWQWDVPEGMELPPMYKNVFSESKFSKNSLYNCNRNPDHVDGIMDLKFARSGQNDDDKDPEDIIEGNLCAIHNLMTDYLGIPECFMGKPILEGQVRVGKGQMEHVHDVPHDWVGQPESPFWDMGNFHTAAREPLFWAHHANIDRLWSIYRRKRRNTVEFPRDDWLESSFVFYDEKNNVVKCKVRDCLDNEKLGYKYEESGPPEWISFCAEKRKESRRLSPRQGKMTQVREFGDRPRELNETIRALVTRPKPSVTRLIKEKEVEIISITGFKFDPRYDARFDVYIAKPANGGAVSSNLGEYVGAFVHIPHSHGKLEDDFNEFCLAIATPLKNINAEESDQLVVSLVPRSGSVIITPVSIVTVPEQSF